MIIYWCKTGKIFINKVINNNINKLYYISLKKKKKNV